jgi:hypothetical protein
MRFNQAQEVKQAVQGIEIADLKVEVTPDVPQVEVELNFASARRHRINPNCAEGDGV